VILYTKEDFADAVRRLAGDKALSVVYDSVAKTTFDKGLDVLRPRGYMVLYGASSGPLPPFDLAQLAAKGSLFVTRPSLVNYIASREELEKRSDEVLGWVASGKLSVRIGAEYPLAEAKAAHDALEGRRTTGKVLLTTG
jgi:NADPH2:quinone reductase